MGLSAALGWLLAGAVVSSLGLLAAVGYASWRVLRPPKLRPDAWRARGRSGAGPVVACLGDSITHGHLGGDWVSELGRRGLDVVNAGANGNLAWNLLQRLEPVIACEPDVVVILIGTNDAMASHDAAAGRRYRKSQGLPQLADLAWYEESLRALVQRLAERTRARIGLMTLPPIGEHPDARIASIIDAENEVIARVARDLQVDLLPLHERLRSLLTGPPPPARFPEKGDKPPLAMVLAAPRRYLLGRSWDGISERAGLTVTVDLVHLSDRSAAVVADLVEGFVRSEPGPARVREEPDAADS